VDQHKIAHGHAWYQYNIPCITISGITKFKMSAKSKMAGKIHVLAYNSEFISRINTQNCTWRWMVSIQCYMYNNFPENGIINANKSKMVTKNHVLAYKGGHIIYLGGHWKHIHLRRSICLLLHTYSLRALEFSGITICWHPSDCSSSILLI
jgi:hypothetical protein